jgi:hypothetical protein
MHSGRLQYLTNKWWKWNLRQQSCHMMMVGGGVYMCVHVGVGGEKSSFFTILLRCVSAAGIGKSITDECGRRVCKAFEIFFLTLHYREHFIS